MFSDKNSVEKNNSRCGTSMHIILLLVGYILASAIYLWRSKNLSRIFFNSKYKINVANAQKFLDKPNFVPAIVIGGGGAGFTAGSYLCQSGFKATIFLGKNIGGAITKSMNVQNWPGKLTTPGKNIAQGLEDQARESGATLLHHEVVEVDFSVWPYKLITVGVTDGEKHVFYTPTCVIATGSTPNYLGVEGEWEFWGNGVTNCAICDASMVKNKDVIVVGGGDSALTEANLLSKYAKQVFVLVRGDKIKAKVMLQDMVKKLPNVKIIFNTIVKKIVGTKNDGVSGAIVQTKDQEEKLMSVRGVFLAIGSKPNTKLFQNQLELDSRGFIKLYNIQETSAPGVFAAGDVVSGNNYRQMIIAAGQGCVAALQSVDFLDQNDLNVSFFSGQKKNAAEKSAQVKNNEVSEAEISAKNTDEPLSSKEKEAEDFSEQDFLPKDHDLVEIETEEEFNQLLSSVGKKNIVIDCYTAWCNTCKPLMQVIADVAPEFESSIVFCKVNIDNVPFVANSYGVKSVPSILFLDNKGNLVKQTVGAVDKIDLKKIIQSTF